MARLHGSALLIYALVLLASGPAPAASPLVTSNAPAWSSPTSAALPNHLGIGLAASPDELTGWLPASGVPWDYAYQYLAAGLHPPGTAQSGQGWESWETGQPDGLFARNYAQRAEAHGYTPVLTYYQIYQSTSAACPQAAGAGCAEPERDLKNLNDDATMRLYFENFALLMQRLSAATYGGIAGAGGTSIVHVEPDLSGYAEQAVLRTDPNACYGLCTGQGNDPTLLKASVASSGMADVAAFPNTYQGFNLALLRLRDRYAPNVLLAFHISTWMTGSDVPGDSYADVATEGTKAGQFAALSGVKPIALPNAPTTTTYDLLFNDVADRDAGYYKYRYNSDRFWDSLNVSLPNFLRWEGFLRAAVIAADNVPVIVWQIPLGNQYFATMNNTPGHYQDNRAEYFFGHIAELRAIGIIGLLFGGGATDTTTNADAQGDGVTNPAPFCTADGRSQGTVCTTHQSVVADDDGGYLRMAAGLYYQGLAVPSPGPPPGPSPNPSPSPGPSPSSPSPTPSPAPLMVTPPLPDQGSVAVERSGNVATLTAAAAAGQLFVGWQVRGSQVVHTQAITPVDSWANPLTLTIAGPTSVTAIFAARPAFGDVPTGDPAANAIAQLAARGVINGCDATAVPPRYCPDAPTLRHQMAALIVRAMPGWADETGLPTFSDNSADTELMTRVATLQRHGVVRGYQDDVCRAQGKPPPCYGPLDTVKYGQVLLFIARAMVEKGYWTLQADDRTVFPDQVGAAGADPDADRQTLDHRMVVTYVHYAGAPPDMDDTHAPFAVVTASGVGGWADDAPRAWFARTFWAALDAYFGQ